MGADMKVVFHVMGFQEFIFLPFKWMMDEYHMFAFQLNESWWMKILGLLDQNTSFEGGWVISIEKMVQNFIFIFLIPISWV
jgi:hypothetical protein